MAWGPRNTVPGAPFARQTTTKPSVVRRLPMHRPSRTTRRQQRGQGPTTPRFFRPELEVLQERTTPSAGVLDPGFDAGGVATAHFGQSDTAVALALQPATSGQAIVVAGQAVDGFSSWSFVARFTSTGQLDTTFQANGAPVQLGGGLGYASTV